MDSLTQQAKEMMEGDASGPIHRDFKVSGPGIQMEVEFTSSNVEKPKHSFFTDMMQKRKNRPHFKRPHVGNFMQRIMKRAKKLRKKMMKKIHRFQHGIPHWMGKMKGGALAFQKRQVFKMNFKKALTERCDEVKTLCPPIKCPMKLIKCLKKKKKKIASENCKDFVQRSIEFRRKMKAIKKQFRAAKKSCKKHNDQWEPRKLCIRTAKHSKWGKKAHLIDEFSAALKSSSMMVVGEPAVDGPDSGVKHSAATEFFENKMNSLKSFMGLGDSKCQNDDSCHKGGDMGGYCKDNGDCHCTAPFFDSDGNGGCALTCTPNSKTPCCRDDKDCQKDGDAGAYCKSPKSSSSTTPGNGQCRCGTGFAGTTSCHKVALKDGVDLTPGKHMSEMTPAWITGDIEEPAGEKDMGGWMARAYTPEQQDRLGVNEMGEVNTVVEPDPANPKDQIMQKKVRMTLSQLKREQPWVLFGTVGLLGAVVFTLAFYIKRRSSVKAIELNAVYDQAMGRGSGSMEQV